MIVNTGDRPVQIGSHLHLPDANAALEFDRAAAHGFRLDIAVGHVAALRARAPRARSRSSRCEADGSSPASRCAPHG